MTDLLRSPWSPQFDALLESASTSLVICSPYIGRGPCQRVKNRLAAADPNAIRVRILTDLSRDNILSGATDVAALAGILDDCSTAEIRFLPSLHAKVYVADERRAIVTSGNFTDAGLLRNFEYGVSIEDPALVQIIRTDVLQYAALGSPINRAELNVLAIAVRDLLELQKSAERSLKSKLRSELGRRLRAIDHDLLRTRAAGRTAHAIFGDAILHLLKKGPLATTELNRAIQKSIPTCATTQLTAS